jgi:predicted metal-binding membrane protein
MASLQIGQPQTLAQLYAGAQDSAPGGSITPEYIRNLLASVTIVPGGVGWALVATGNSLPTALPLLQQFNRVATTPAGTGVSLPLSNGVVGLEMTIVNGGANALLVYALAGDVIITDENNSFAEISLAVKTTVKLCAMAPGFWVVTSMWTGS